MFASLKYASLPYSLQTSASAAVLAGTLFTASAMAVDLADNVQVHGFASQAYVSTTANKYFGPSDSGSFDFRELGANLSWQALPKLQFAAQIGSRKAGETDEAKPRFDYALIDFEALNNENGRVGGRAGRYRIPFGLYNLTRDVANSRPSIFLPESIYSDASRQYLLSMDGGEIYGEVRTGVGDFFLEYGQGKFILDDATKQTIRVTPSATWRLLYEHDGGVIRLALSGIEASLGYIQPPYPDGKVNLNLHVYSAQYNSEQWSLTGEYMPTNASLSGLVIGGFPLPDIVQKSEAYYLQGTYRIATDWEALLRYDVQYSNKDDRSGQNSATATTPAHRFFTKDLTVGVGWSVRPDTKIRAEWHRLNGTSWLSTKENPVLNDMKQYWDMFALQASYSF